MLSHVAELHGEMDARWQSEPLVGSRDSSCARQETGLITGSSLIKLSHGCLDPGHIPTFLPWKATWP